MTGFEYFNYGATSSLNTSNSSGKTGSYAFKLFKCL